MVKKTKKKTKAKKRSKPIKVTFETKTQDSAGKKEPAEMPANVEFEQVVAAMSLEPEKPKDRRGGAREGAGRKKGLTDEKAKVKNLPQYPSNPIRQGCQALFDLWAAAAKIEELALSDEDADILSLPLTQLQEYYFPGILPEIAGTWIMLIFATTRIIKPRIDLVNKVRAERRSAKEAQPQAEPEESTDQLWHFAEPGGNLLHPIGPTDKGRVTFKASNVTCPTCIKLMAKKSMN